MPPHLTTESTTLGAASLLCPALLLSPDFAFQSGQVCGSRPCLGGSDALAKAYCRQIVVETASSRESRQLRRTLDMLRADDTLATYKPDRTPGR